MKNIFKLIGILVFLVVVFSCSNTPEQDVYEVEITTGESTEPSEPYVYEEPESNNYTSSYSTYKQYEYGEDTVDDVIGTESVSYWYVSYYVNPIKKDQSSYNGYTTIKLNTPYFNPTSAIWKVKPDYKDGDYVEIRFCIEIPEEAYNPNL